MNGPGPAESLNDHEAKCDDHRVIYTQSNSIKLVQVPSSVTLFQIMYFHDYDGIVLLFLLSKLSCLICVLAVSTYSLCIIYINTINETQRC